jgi:PAS domain S-box-containing protein
MNHSAAAGVSVEEERHLRERAMEQLKRSEMRFRHMVENNVVGIIIANFDGRIIDANDSFLRMVGYDRSDLKAGRLNWLAMTPPEYADRDRKAIEEIRESGECTSFEKEYIRKDGSRVPILIGASLYYGGPEDCVCFVLDRSESKRTQEALRASEKRFRSLIEHSTDAVSLFDRREIVQYVSPAVKRILGFEPEEVIGHNGFELVHPDDAPAVRERFAKLVQTPGMTHTSVYRCRHKDGSWRWIEGTGTNLLDEPSIAAVVGNFHDITERRQLMEELEQRAEELAEANRRKDEFLAMLAHELRNPLAPILNGLHIMRQDRSESPILKQARLIIERQVQNMVRLVDDLLDVSRITRGKIQLRKEQVELGVVIERAVENAKTIIDARRHKLTVAAPAEPIWLEGDPTRLEQIFTNLLTNAAKYTDPGGRIGLTVERHGPDVVVNVRDNGIGIAPKMLAHIFDLFTQADRALDRSQGGLGIGLTVVKRLVEMHGGTVSAASAGPGKGSEFSVRLPVFTPAAERPPEDAVAATPRGKGPMRVLVVEDNVDAAESVALLLRLYGHEVQVVHTGPAGLEAAHAFHPNVVLLDIGLPGMDGYEVAKRLRQDAELKRVPLIAMTGYSREEDRSRSREAGIDQHLVKPVEPEKLRELLTLIDHQRGPLR